jgi:hypothetical protein
MGAPAASLYQPLGPLMVSWQLWEEIACPLCVGKRSWIEIRDDHFFGWKQTFRLCPTTRKDLAIT